MSSLMQKMTVVTLKVPDKARETLARQAKERGIAVELWTGQVFDAGFAAVCAREKSLPITDADLEAIVGATALLRAKEQWDTATLAKSLGISEPTVVRILDGWKLHRTGMGETSAADTAKANDAQATLLQDALSKEDLLGLKMRRQFRIVLEMLVRHGGTGGYVSTERLAAKVWEDHHDGGPDDANGAIHNYVCKMRQEILNAHGWTITVSRGEGYRLERLP